MTKSRPFLPYDIVHETAFAIHCHHAPGHLDKIYETPLVHGTLEAGAADRTTGAAESRPLRRFR